MSFDAGSILATADLDKRPFIRAISELRAEAKKLTTGRYTATVDADTRPGEEKVLPFERRLRGISTSRTTARVSADTTDALLKIKPLTDRLASIQRDVTTARVRLEGNDRALRQLDSLDISLKAIGQRVARPRVSLAGVESADIQLDRLGLKIREIGAMTARPGVSGGGFFGSGGTGSRLAGHAPGGIGLAAGLALPTVAPLAGVAVGGLSSLLTPTIAGGIGGGLFAKVAESSYQQLDKTMQKLTADQAKYNAATSNKTRAAALRQENRDWAALSKPQVAAITNIHKLNGEWAGFQKKLEPQSFKLLATGTDIADKGLKLLLPTVKASGNAIDGWATGIDHALNQPFWHDFFGNFLPGEAHRALTTLGHDVSAGVTGIANLMEKFAPLGHDLEDATRGWANKFESWTKSDGPGKFVNWVEKNGPTVVDDIKGIARGITGLGKGLAPIGGLELKAFAGIGNFIGDLADDHPKVITALGAALLTVSVGLKGIAAAKSATEVIGAIKGLRGGGKIGNVFGDATGKGGLGCCCPGGPGGAGGSASTAEKDASTAGEDAGKTGWFGRTISRVGRGAGGVLSDPLLLPLADVIRAFGPDVPDPLAHRYTANQARDSVSAQPLWQSLAKMVQSLPGGYGTGGQAHPSSVGQGGLSTGLGYFTGKGSGGGTLQHVNVDQAVGYTLATGTAQQVRQLKELGKTYPQVQTALDRYNASQRTLAPLLLGTAAATQSAQSKADIYAQHLADQGVPLDKIISKTETYASKLKGIPPGVNTKVIADTAAAQANVDSLLTKLGQVVGHDWTAVVSSVTHWGSTPANGHSGGGNVQGHNDNGTGNAKGSSSRARNIARSGTSSLTSHHLAFHPATAHAASASHPPGWYTKGNDPSPNSGGSSSSAGGSGSGSGSSSSSQHHGPSKATTANALAAITQFAGLTFTSDLRGTEHQIRSGIGQMIDRLNNAVRNKYLTGDKTLVKALRDSRKDLVGLAQAEDDTSKALSSARSRLSTLQSNASSTRQGALSSFLGLGDLTQASQTTSLGGLLSVDGQQVKVARAFDRNLALLRKRGLASDEYKTLEGEGPAAAGQVVALLAGANKRQFRQFNADESILRRLGVSTGQASAQYLYGSKISDAKGDVSGLRAQQHHLEQLQKRAADALDTLVKDGIQDKGTHAGLKTLNDSLKRVENAIANLSGVGKRAATDARAHVAGVSH